MSATLTGVLGPQGPIEDSALTATDYSNFEKFETMPPNEVIKWAIDNFGEDVVLAASFQDCVLVDVVTRVAPDIEVVFIDTGSHFKETLNYVDDIRARYDLRLVRLKPGYEAAKFPCGTDGCCEMKKVKPFDEFLKKNNVKAWISGIKRVDTAERNNAPVVGIDQARGIVKINPIVRWSDDDVESYSKLRNLPVHPMTAKGYLSIGCAPTTKPVELGSSPRSGRWSDQEKTECGLHLS